ncbi:hypothetical protein [Nitrobacter sp.]|uniref:hypothetical protein n=1 Tax=Nitrobacter sp. TaxID=29420 RepID=UPI002628FD61|nr:hypothetical protein [Nitrobacter sp.]
MSKMRCAYSISVIFFGFLPTQTAHAAFDDNQASYSRRNHEKSVTNRNYDNLESLTETELRSIISGKTISPDPDRNEANFIFREQFSSDGSWASFRQMRVSFIERGKWFMEDGALCVEKDTGVKVCRDVERDQSSGHLYLSDILGPDSEKIFVIVI